MQCGRIHSSVTSGDVFDITIVCGPHMHMLSLWVSVLETAISNRLCLSFVCICAFAVEVRIPILVFIPYDTQYSCR